MDDLLESMGRLGVQNVKSLDPADILLDLLSHMSVKDASGKQIQASTGIQTAVGEIPLNELLNKFSNFSEILASSPYSVRVNPRFVPLTVGGITFSETYVPRDKNKPGWKGLSLLCGRTFFKEIKGRTLYERLRRSYYSSDGTKTILKINGSYFIYNNVDKTLTQVQMPSGFTDYTGVLDQMYDEFDKVRDLELLRQLLYEYEDSLLSGFKVVDESLRNKLRAQIDSLPIFKAGYVMNTSNRSPPPLILKRRERSPELMEPVEAMELERLRRPDREVYSAKKRREDRMLDFGKSKKLTKLSKLNKEIRSINSLIKLIKKM